ncbi:MAG: type II toxin-antitoxin system HicB family antitoxin [Thermoanaerobaculia bacterium]
MYVAVAPDLSFCTGLGKTPEQAHARLELAMSLWFESDGAPLCGPDSGREESRD